MANKDKKFNLKSHPVTPPTKSEKKKVKGRNIGVKKTTTGFKLPNIFGG